MIKHKFIKPGQILNIISGSFLIIAAIIILMDLIRLNVVQYYTLITIIDSVVIALSIGMIVMASLCLGFTKGKTYTSNGKIFCFLTICIETLLIILGIVDMVLFIKMSNSIKFSFAVSLASCLIMAIALFIGYKKSVVGTKEEIEEALKIARKPSPKIIQKSISIENAINVEKTLDLEYEKTKSDVKNVSYSSQLERIEKLYDLFEKGLISKEEYEDKKKSILSEIK